METKKYIAKLVEDFTYLKPKSEQEIFDNLKNLNDIGNFIQTAKDKDLVKKAEDLYLQNTNNTWLLQDLLRYTKNEDTRISTEKKLLSSYNSDTSLHDYRNSLSLVKNEDIRNKIKIKLLNYLKRTSFEQIMSFEKYDSIDELFLKEKIMTKDEMSSFINNLLEKNVTDPKLKNVYPLGLFFKYNRIDLIKKILNSGDNSVSFLSNVGYLADHYKTREITKLVKELLDETSANKVFSNAVQTHNYSMMIDAIKRGATNVNIGHNEAVQYAARTNNIELLKLLLKNPLVNPGDNTVDGVRYERDETNDAIRRAAQNGHLEAVKLLLKHPKVDPSAVNNFALKHSIKNKHYKVAELLLNDKRVQQSISQSDLIKLMKKLFQINH